MESDEQVVQPPVVSLRPFTLDDINAATTWLTDDRVGRNMRWDTCKSKAEVLAFFEDFILPHPWCRAICVDDNDLVGFVYAAPFIGFDACRAEFGICLAWEHTGKGFATAAMRVAVQEVLEIWPKVERLEARVEVGNLASQRMLEKAGFTREVVLKRFRIVKGKLLDMVQFCILR